MKKNKNDMFKEHIHSDDNVQVFKYQNIIEINYLQPHKIILDTTNSQDIDSEVIRMIKMKTLYNKKYFVQKIISKIIGVSRQMVNRRWQVYNKEGLIPLLEGSFGKSKITQQLIDRLTELAVDNPFLTSQQLISILKSEKVCNDISTVTIYNAQKLMDGRKIIKLLKKKGDKLFPEAFIGSEFLIEKLFEIIECLINKMPLNLTKEIFNIKIIYENLKNQFNKVINHRNANIKNDKYIKRKKLDRDKKRNINFIKRIIQHFSLSGKCPDCNSTNIKEIKQRDRYYINEKGEKIKSYSTVYRCKNHMCSTKYFTIPPKSVELYARVNKKVKKLAFRLFFHLRATYSRVTDELKENNIVVNLTTVLRWVKKAGEEKVPMFNIFKNKEDYTQPIVIDEKWIKIRSEWNYVFTAVGEKINDLFAIDLFKDKSKESMKTFLLYIKSLGFNPKIIATDLLMGYSNTIKEIFPKCYHHECVLHAERCAKRFVWQALYNKKIEYKTKKLIIKKIRNLFSSKKLKQVKKRYKKIMEIKNKFPKDTHNVFKMLKKYYPKLCESVLNKDIPKTTNAVERMIGEFAEKYQGTKGFTSFYYAKFFTKAYQIYYRFRKISFGIFKKKSRLELKGYNVSNIDFTEYLTPTYH